MENLDEVKLDFSGVELSNIPQKQRKKNIFSKEEVGQMPIYKKWMYDEIICKQCKGKTGFYAFYYVLTDYNITCLSCRCQ